MAFETHVLGCTSHKAHVLWYAPTQRWAGTKHGCACAARSRMHTYDMHQQPVLGNGHTPGLENGNSATAQHAALCLELSQESRSGKRSENPGPENGPCSLNLIVE